MQFCFLFQKKKQRIIMRP
uniref:Uncharacterized protein n=1 Tax=Anguilla anguilla TaxID=7936 RepID=A0A0E9VR68_ANGAN